jgi:hypothetical protein
MMKNLKENTIIEIFKSYGVYRQNMPSSQHEGLAFIKTGKEPLIFILAGFYYVN